MVNGNANRGLLWLQKLDEFPKLLFIYCPFWGCPKADWNWDIQSKTTAHVSVQNCPRNCAQTHVGRNSHVLAWTRVHEVWLRQLNRHTMIMATKMLNPLPWRRKVQKPHRHVSVYQSELTECLAPCHTLPRLHYWTGHNWEVFAVHPPQHPIKQQLEFCRATEDKNHSEGEAFTQLHCITPRGIINSG